MEYKTGDRIKVENKVAQWGGPEAPPQGWVGTHFGTVAGFSEKDGEQIVQLRMDEGQAKCVALRFHADIFSKA